MPQVEGDGWPIAKLVGHRGDVNDVSMSAENPSLIASAGDDSFVRFWSPEHNPIQQTECSCGWNPPQNAR